MWQAQAQQTLLAPRLIGVANAAVVPVLAFTLWGCGDDSTSSSDVPLTPEPTVLSISPIRATAGSPDVVVTITGADFGNQAHLRSQAVWSVDDSETPLATTFVNTNQLTAVIPAALLVSPDTAGILVESGDPVGNRSGSRTRILAFAVIGPPPPAIRISPEFAQQGDSDLVLTIVGSGFAGQRFYRSEAVWSWNGINTSLNTTFVSDTELTAVVAESLLTTPGTAQVFVQTGDPMGDRPLLKTAAASFRIISPAPPPFSISPTSAIEGDSALVLTVRGAGFGGRPHFHSLVLWSRNGTSTYLSTTFVSETELTARIPARLLAAPGTVQVFVETGDPMSDFPLPQTLVGNFEILPRSTASK